MNSKVRNIFESGNGELRSLAAFLTEKVPTVEKAYVLQQIPEQGGTYFYLIASGAKFFEVFLSNSSEVDSTFEISEKPTIRGRGRLSAQLREQIESLRKIL